MMGCGKSLNQLTNEARKGFEFAPDRRRFIRDHIASMSVASAETSGQAQTAQAKGLSLVFEGCGIGSNV